MRQQLEHVGRSLPPGDDRAALPTAVALRLAHVEEAITASISALTHRPHSPSPTAAPSPAADVRDQLAALEGRLETLQREAKGRYTELQDALRRHDVRGRLRGPTAARAKCTCAPWLTNPCNRAGSVSRVTNGRAGRGRGRTQLHCLNEAKRRAKLTVGRRLGGRVHQRTRVRTDPNTQCASFEAVAVGH